jgi:error-prone DNA polymerase
MVFARIVRMSAPVELQTTSNFSFLRGGSHPQELAARAAELGYEAIGLCDRNTLAGAVRAHAACKLAGIRLVVGCRLDLMDGFSLLCFPQDRDAYGRLCELLTLGKRRAKKSKCDLSYADILDHRDGQWVAALAPEDPGSEFKDRLQRLRGDFGRRAHLMVNHLYRGDDRRRIAGLIGLAEAARVPPVAGNNVLYHVPERRMLQDALTCVRHGLTIEKAGLRLLANAERHLKSPEEMRRLFASWPLAIERAAQVAERCRFSLDELRYEYPSEPVPEGMDAQSHLETLTWAGAASRYPDGVPERVVKLLRHELSLIAELAYAPYFLTVHDIVRFARDRAILCQGRGSAANSAVCYCLGITAVDPNQIDLLFERFVSAERNEPPDIDVDFEHERREEVIQYIYAKYGRERAGLAASVIRYRPKSALRDMGKVMGLSEDTLGVLSKTVWGWAKEGIDEDPIREAGLDPGDRRLRLVLALARELVGFPRHLSQHVGGFVITRGRLSTVTPIENAAMADRTCIEWDKDDLDALGILKIDVLALGMLTCIRKAFELTERHQDRRLDLAGVPREDPAVYDMLCKADSIGVFQVESRAQMTMLPRLKPRTFYDLVIEVAIVRPGPIQGDMVHPYLRRRNGEEAVAYPSPELRQVLEKTYGVPLFQEQAMRIAIVAAGFTPSEADRLRRAMATFRKVGTIHTFQEKLVRGMTDRGYDRDFAERCFKQIEGFGEYGFPESHAASFALLVYVSAWLKRHYPAAFACALLNAQPMGFYAPAQIVRDARDHGVEVRPIDINASGWDNDLEPGHPGPALRLGFREIVGLRKAEADRLVDRREAGYRSIQELARRANLNRSTLEVLARADAFSSLGLDRRRALWRIHGVESGQLPLFANDAAPSPEPPAEAEPLPPMTAGENVIEDYDSTGMSLRAHPLALLRARLRSLRVIANERLGGIENGVYLKASGLVLVRQRPGTASGVIFMTLEDETGIANIVVWPKVFERYRRTVLTSRLLAVEGKLQREGLVIHVIAERLIDLSHLLDNLAAIDAPTDGAIANAQAGAGEIARRQSIQRLKSRDFH